MTSNDIIDDVLNKILGGKVKATDKFDFVEALRLINGFTLEQSALLLSAILIIRTVFVEDKDENTLKKANIIASINGNALQITVLNEDENEGEYNET